MTSIFPGARSEEHKSDEVKYSDEESSEHKSDEVEYSDEESSEHKSDEVKYSDEKIPLKSRVQHFIKVRNKLQEIFLKGRKLLKYMNKAIKRGNYYIAQRHYKQFGIKGGVFQLDNPSFEREFIKNVVYGYLIEAFQFQWLRQKFIELKIKFRDTFPGSPIPQEVANSYAPVQQVNPNQIISSRSRIPDDETSTVSNESSIEKN